MRVALRIEQKARQRKYTVLIGSSGKTLPLKTYCEKLGINSCSITQSLEKRGMGEGYHYKEFDDLVRLALVRAQKRQNIRFEPCAECQGFGWKYSARLVSQSRERIDCAVCDGTGSLDKFPKTKLSPKDELRRTVAQVDQMQARLEASLGDNNAIPDHDPHGAAVRDTDQLGRETARDDRAAHGGDHAETGVSDRADPGAPAPVVG